MRRPIASAVAVFCVLTQLALGVSATLGLVFCVGDDHAGIELASDDCCAAHAATESAVPALRATDCCSDIPLYASARLLPEVRREAAALVVVLPPAATTALLGTVPGFPVSSASFPAAPSARRTIVLRV